MDTLPMTPDFLQNTPLHQRVSYVLVVTKSQLFLATLFEQENKPHKKSGQQFFHGGRVEEADWKKAVAARSG